MIPLSDGVINWQDRLNWKFSSRSFSVTCTGVSESLFVALTWYLLLCVWIHNLLIF